MQNKGSAILVIHFIVVDAAKLETGQSTSVYRGECVYHTCIKVFKDKARLQLHSKNFSLKQLCNALFVV